MIYEELTKRDIYMYNRGMLDEYIRSHQNISLSERSLLFEWIRRGNDIHSNPFGLYDDKKHRSYDYLDAMRMASARKK